MRASGVGSVRAAFYWRSLQPQPAQPVRWGATDRIVEAAARNGLAVLPVLVRSPAWAAKGDTREGAVPEADLYAAFVGEAVRRYGPGGSFWAERPDVPALPVRSWQLWNEPDIDRYLAPIGRSWMEAYVPILRAGHGAVKAADPDRPGRRRRADEPQLGGPRAALQGRRRARTSTPRRSTRSAGGCRTSSRS